ncbi:hypothetical protein BIW11_04627 [Tropilaelaps mercedesae]|uniref:Uncharacterized protein n=1 Tax=Tropilaelaps mercedesae TaxID=418985 RepID=A0A1V9X3V9_9ACAR|nr:hypothetical protein BIW11_04627 [Tropilaelaps mercedesae]
MDATFSGVSLLTLCFYALRFMDDPNALPNFQPHSIDTANFTSADVGQLMESSSATPKDRF